jgi:hypothetical protein
VNDLLIEFLFTGVAFDAGAISTGALLEDCEGGTSELTREACEVLDPAFASVLSFNTASSVLSCCEISTAVKVRWPSSVFRVFP